MNSMPEYYSPKIKIIAEIMLGATGGPSESEGQEVI